jgi:thiamine biosynthesis lipoprotein
VDCRHKVLNKACTPLAHAMATAVMVCGQESAKWFGQPELAVYWVSAVNRHEENPWGI